ncbi:MAG: di-trans,poly-cis-decaprenylcistransferase [Bacilli bacterium]|nr:di-trans,poly-cis-decaprenylcistransferase [Bacilli bacterium]
METPKTIAVILDGNGRWAEAHGKKRYEGHTAGIFNLIRLMDAAFSMGVENVICYGLSTENLFREKIEVDHIYELMLQVHKSFVETFTKREASVKYVGKIEKLPEPVKLAMQKSEEALKAFEGNGKKMYIGVAYGSRNEIVEAINDLVEKGEKVDEKSFLEHLSVPIEPELLIRTGGEKRLSNFLLYQLSYTELYFSDKLFPDFTPDDLKEAIEWFKRRDRRYGLIKKK